MPTRVFELARDLNLTSKVVLDVCRANGLEFKNHMAPVSSDLEQKIRALLAGYSDDAVPIQSPQSTIAAPASVRPPVGIPRSPSKARPGAMAPQVDTAFLFGQHMKHPPALLVDTSSLMAISAATVLAKEVIPVLQSTGAKIRLIQAVYSEIQRLRKNAKEKKNAERALRVIKTLMDEDVVSFDNIAGRQADDHLIELVYSLSGQGPVSLFTEDSRLTMDVLNQQYTKSGGRRKTITALSLRSGKLCSTVVAVMNAEGWKPPATHAATWPA